MKSERVVSNPENHGWEEVNGKWIWASGRNTGHIVDGDTEGQIATWHDPANAWTPSNHVIVDSATGNATFSGRVGIHDSPVGGEFVVKVGADNKIAMNTASYGSTDVARISAFDNAVSTGVPLAIEGKELRLRTDTVDRLTIDSSGNVGIGLDGPSEKLHLYDPAGTAIRMSGPGSAQMNLNASGSLVFDTANNPRLTIDSTGNATFSGTVDATVVAGRDWRKKTVCGIRILDTKQIVPLDGNGVANASGQVDLGNNGDRFKNLYITGSVVSTRHGTSLGTRDLIETLATLRASTLDETVDVRQALASACDKLIEKFESMQEVATQEVDADG